MWNKRIGLAVCATLFMGAQSAYAASNQPVNDSPQLTASYQYSIQVEEDGTVWTFGRSPGGKPQVGRQQGGALEQIVQASAGYAHAAAVDADGRVWTWGGNEVGQRGQGDDASRTVADAVPLGDGERAVSVASGYDHTLALTEDGTVWAWGSNRYGQLGDGTEIDRDRPTRVMNGKQPLDDVTAIAAGFGLSYALDKEGTVWGWGDMGKHEGDMLPVMQNVGNRLEPLDGIVSIAAGYDHALALDRDGKLYAWGSNRGGQLGIGDSVAYSLHAVRLEGGPRFTTIAAGEQTSSAIDEDGNIWVWGAAYPTDPRNRSAGDRFVPEQLTEGVSFVSVTVGRDHGMAMDEDERIWVWGANDFGQLAHAYKGFTAVNPVVKKQLERSLISPGLSSATVEETTVVGQQGVLKLRLQLKDDAGRLLDDKWPTAELRLRGLDPIIEPLEWTASGTYSGELSIPFPYYLLKPSIEIRADGETIAEVTAAFQ